MKATAARAVRARKEPTLLQAAEAARDFIGAFRGYSRIRRQICCSSCSPLECECGTEKIYKALTLAIRRARRRR